MSAAPRIAILTHSTNPRGGVVHALELGDALTRLGHDVTVHAPDVSGASFFRETACKTVGVPAAPAPREVRQMAEMRVADYLRFFERAPSRCFDVWHAQDGISGNALAALKQRRLIDAFARTVHHVDDFADQRLGALQRRGIVAADRLFTVSRVWRDWLEVELGRNAVIVGNGVDLSRFSSHGDGADAQLRHRLDLRSVAAPVFLAIGGVEERKNTLRMLRAFALVHAKYPQSRLIIAGGASLLDHDAYQSRFAAALSETKLPSGAVIRTGPLPQKLMPALYRTATAFVFPSLREGFGLVVLEAMASGLPVAVSRIAPFTEYLGEDEASWCDPLDTASIAAAMTRLLDPGHSARLRVRGPAVAARHNWTATARAHLATYEELRERVNA